MTADVTADQNSVKDRDQTHQNLEKLIPGNGIFSGSLLAIIH